MRHFYRNYTLVLLFLPMLVIADGDPNELAEPMVESKVETRINSRAVLNPQALQLQGASANRVVQFYASDKSAELLYEVQRPVFNLNNSRAYASILFTEERDNALAGSILFDTDLDFIPGLTLSFGSKVYAGLLAIENADVFGLGASIEAAYLLPVKRFPLNLIAAVNYAPDILTFGQSDRIFDWHARAELPLTKSISGFVGVRFLQFDTRPGDRELDKKVHIGVRWLLND